MTMKFIEVDIKENDGNEEMVMIDEFAKLLGNIPTCIIKRYLREGKIKGIKKSRIWFIPLKEAQRILGSSES